MASTPRALRRQVFVQAPIRVIDPAVQRELRRAIVERPHLDQLQQRDRIVIQLAPQQGIQLAKERGALVIPAPPEVLRQLAQPVMRRRHEVLRRSSIVHEGSQLRPRHRQHPDVVIAERARAGGLHDEHALEHAVVNNRHAQEGPVRILARVTEILEAGMRRRVGDADRAHPLGDEPCETLGRSHAHPSDTVGTQPDRGGEHQRRAVGLEQIHGTDIGGESPLNEVDDVGEGLRRVSAA